MQDWTDLWSRVAWNFLFELQFITKTGRSCAHEEAVRAASLRDGLIPEKNETGEANTGIENQRRIDLLQNVFSSDAKFAQTHPAQANNLFAIEKVEQKGQ